MNSRCCTGVSVDFWVFICRSSRKTRSTVIDDVGGGDVGSNPSQFLLGLPSGGRERGSRLLPLHLPTPSLSRHTQPLSLAAWPKQGAEGEGAATSHAGCSGSLLWAAWRLPARAQLVRQQQQAMPLPRPGCWGQGLSELESSPGSRQVSLGLSPAARPWWEGEPDAASSPDRLSLRQPPHRPVTQSGPIPLPVQARLPGTGAECARGRCIGRKRAPPPAGNSGGQRDCGGPRLDTGQVDHWAEES